MQERMIQFFSIGLIIVGIPLLLFLEDIHTDESIVGKVIREQGRTARVSLTVDVRSPDGFRMHDCIAAKGFWALQNSQPIFYTREQTSVTC